MEQSQGRAESILFWALAAVTVAALVVLGALLTGHLASEEGATATAPAPDFSITVAPRRQRVAQAADARYTVSLRAPDGFAADVRLSLAGATGHFSRDRLRPPASTVLTVTTSLQTVPATYPIRVTARTGRRTRWVRVTLVVTAA